MMLDSLPTIITVSLAIFITSYLGYALLQIAAEKVSFKLRARYMASLMRQEVEYFEQQQVEALPSKLAENFTNISNGSGEKCGQLLSTAGATVTGISIGLILCPYYALVLLAYLPFAYFFMKSVQKVAIKTIFSKMGLNAKLGGFTEECLGALKLVISFGREDHKIKEYSAIA